MAEVVRYVNTASTAGGDGTTPSTTPSDPNRAYASLNEWEANEGTNLVTDGDTHRVICSGTADSTATTINGFTVGASNFVTVEGEYDGSAGRLDTSLYHFTAQLTVDEDYCVFNKMQFEGNGTVNQGLFFGNSKNDGAITNCVFHDQARYGSFQSAGANNVTYENCLFYDIGRSPVGVSGTATGMGELYNCTAYNINTANVADASFVQQDANGQFKAVNCICLTAVRAEWEETYTLASGSDYLMDSDASAPGANSVNSVTVANQFTSTTGGSEDFHLKSGSDAEGAGVGPTTDAAVPTPDPDGDTRSGTTCDIGWDEFVGGGGGATPKNPFGLMLSGPFKGPIS